jgi:phosphonopyruvate decarboxylase
MQIDDFGAILREQGIRCGAGVPCSYFTPLVNYMAVEPQLDYLGATSEGEAVAIGAGLVAGGKPAFALMQNSGLGNAVNPITSLLYIYDIPLLLLISHRGQPGLPDEPQHELMGRISEDLARLCELDTRVMDPQGFAEQLSAARASGKPAAFIVQKGSLEGGPKAPPIGLELRSAQVRPDSAGIFSPRMAREQALVRVAPLLNAGLDSGRAPAVIATTGKLSRELYELDDRDHSKHNRFYMVGSMGCAAAFGLGVARAQPWRKTIVLDGDGALLMKLGTLVTAGRLGLENFHHVVFDNGAHDSTGGQPTASPSADLATMALACGYRAAETVSAPEALEEVLPRQLATPGPTFLRIAVRTGARKDLGRPKRSPKEGWRWFTEYLQRWQGEL